MLIQWQKYWTSKLFKCLCHSMFFYKDSFNKSKSQINRNMKDTIKQMTLSQMTYILMMQTLHFCDHKTFPSCLKNSVNLFSIVYLLSNILIESLTSKGGTVVLTTIFRNILQSAM